jgi:hypothetical protein
MGSVNWRKRGNRYQVAWRFDDGTQGAKTVATKDEALDLVAEKRLEMSRNAWQRRRRGRLPFSRWADEWWVVWSTDPSRSPTTLAATEIRLRRHVRPFFGDRAGCQEGVCAGGRDRFRTCGLCRVKGARPPRAPTSHPASHYNVTAQWWWRAKGTRCRVWRSEASFLANLWQGRSAI